MAHFVYEEKSALRHHIDEDYDRLCREPVTEYRSRCVRTQIRIAVVRKVRIDLDLFILILHDSVMHGSQGIWSQISALVCPISAFVSSN